MIHSLLNHHNKFPGKKNPTTEKMRREKRSADIAATLLKELEVHCSFNILLLFWSVVEFHVLYLCMYIQTFCYGWSKEGLKPLQVILFLLVIAPKCCTYHQSLCQSHQDK